MRLPVVQRARRLVGLAQVEHRNIDLVELLGSNVLGDDSVDFGIARPDVLQGDRLAVGVVAERVAFDVEAYRAGDRVGDHQRRGG